MAESKITSNWTPAVRPRFVACTRAHREEAQRTAWVSFPWRPCVLVCPLARVESMHA